MANEFIVRKGLIVEGASGGTVVDIQGSQGQLFSVTDDLSGSIFAVSDISGVPIFDVNSSGVSYFDGKVGIGTTAPGQLLHLNEGSAVTTTDANNMLLLTRDDHSYIMFSCPDGKDSGLHFHNTTDDSFVGRIAYDHNATGDNMLFTVDSSEAMRIEAGGNVGIGTTDPAHPLDVYTNTDNGYVARFSQDNATGWGVLIDTDGVSNNDPALWVKNATSTVLWAAQSGNVGIGTGAPGTKLDVDGAITAGTANSTSGSVLMYGKYSNGHLATIGTEYSNGGLVLGYGVTPSTTAAGGFVSSSAATNLTRGAYSFAAGTHKWWSDPVSTTIAVGTTSPLNNTMTLLDTGNLGIGTTAPGTKLQVNGDISVTSGDAYRMFNAAGTGWGEMSLNETDNIISFNRGVENTNDDWKLSVDSADSFVCAAQGDFGIGTTAPSQKLHVAGNARVTGAFYDSTNSPGTAGQVLSSTATGTDWVAAGSGSTVYTAAIWEVDSDIFTADNTTIVCDTNRIYNGTTSVSTAGPTTGSLVMDVAGVYEISYSVAVRVPQSGAPSTRQVPALYLTLTPDGGTEAKIPGSLNSTYLRLYGSNQGGFTSFSNKIYVETDENGEVQLKIVWLDGTDKDVEIYSAAGIQNTISIRRIT